MDKSRRNFLRSVLPVGAAVVGVTTVGAVTAMAEEDKGVPLFVCGNCTKWELKERINVKMSPLRRRAFKKAQQSYKEVRKNPNWPYQSFADHCRKCFEEEKRLHPQEWESELELSRRGNAFPGSCPYLNNQIPYSDDPACENFDLKKEGGLITWKKGDKK